MAVVLFCLGFITIVLVIALVAEIAKVLLL